MTEHEARMMEKIFNPYNEPIKQAELNDVDAHWEIIENECSGKSWLHGFTPTGSLQTGFTI